MENYKSKIITVSKRHWWLTASAALSFALMLLGAATLVLIQKPIQESQDLRQQASVVNGQVLMAFNPATNSTLQVNQPASISFQINTQAVQIDGVQLVFNVITDTLGTPPEFTMASGSGLQMVYQEVEQVSDGYLVTVAFFSQTTPQPFSASSLTSFGQLNFTPTSTGTIEINFDEDESISTVNQVVPPVDELRHMDTLIYTVTETASASPTVSPSATASASPVVSASPTASPSVSPTVSPSPSATVTTSPSPTATPLVTPTPTPTPGVGGTTVSCNQSCSSNAECAANHRCYNGQCRLVTNVSSSSCSAASNPDNGLNRTCNQYCADNRECMAGYSCYFNRCRNPLNVENTSCAIPSRQVVQAITSSCNQKCSSHKDCAANLFCHSSGSCRLVTNPASTSCSPAMYSTVSNMYGSKGGSTGSTKTDGVTPTSSSKPGSATSSASPKVTSSPLPTTGTTDTEDNLPLQKKSAFDSFREYFIDQLTLRGITIPVFFIATGLGLLLIVIILSILMRLLGGNSNKPPMITPVGRDRDKAKDTKYENQLASKINTLQQTQQPSTPIGSTITPPPSAVNSSSPMPSARPMPMASAPAPSGMMARLQDKGIKPPQS